MPIRNKFLKHLIFFSLSSLSAIACVYSFPNDEYSLIGMISLIPMLFLIHYTKQFKVVFWYGLWMGALTLGLGFNWLHYTINIYGALGSIGAIPIFLIFCFAFGFKFALTFLVTAFVGKRLRISRILLYPLVFVGVELIFPEVFPWYWGAFLYNDHLAIQMAEFIGVQGLTFIIVIINVLIFEIMIYFLEKRKFPKVFFISGILFILIVHIIGYLRINYIEKEQESAEEVVVAMIQPNTKMGRKSWDDRNYIRERCFELSKAVLKKANENGEKVHLLVWPESAAPFSFQNYSESRDEPFVVGLKKLAFENQIYIYFSDYLKAKDAESNIVGRELLYNNSTLIDRNGHIVDSYQKIYLLPFGEYLPGPVEWLASKLDFMNTWVKNVGNFTPGKNDHSNIKVLKTDRVRFIPQICYEVIIPSFTRKFSEVENGDFIVNITNDKWFGNTKASMQHLILAKIRTIENRIPLVRSTNSGISAVIDAKGDIVAGPTKLDDEDTLYQKIKMLDINTIYKQFGDIFSFLCLILLIIYIIFDYYLWRKEKISKQAK